LGKKRDTDVRTRSLAKSKGKKNERWGVISAELGGSPVGAKEAIKKDKLCKILTTMGQAESVRT